MAYSKYISTLYLMLPILLSCHGRRPYTQFQLQGAGYLYAMNFQYGDSLWVKRQMPVADYKKFIVELNAFPYFQDTLQDGNVMIFYSWSRNNIQLKPTMLTYNGLELDPFGEVVKLYAGDQAIVSTRKNDDQSAFESMIRFIENNSGIKPGLMLNECLKRYKAGGFN